jgi:hypothetical protein
VGRTTPSTTNDLLGRRARSLRGPATALAAGNSVITSDLRGGGSPAAYPGADNGGQAQSSTIRARQGGLITPTTPDLRGPDQSRAAYGGGWADGRLTIRERFVMAMRGTSRTGAQESHSGVPNPQEDGPPQPQYLMDSRTESYQAGTDQTAYEDNAGPFARTTLAKVDYRTAPQNKGGAGVVPFTTRTAFPLGNQGDPWTTVMGPALGEYRDYGARGVTGMHGPQPRMFALPGDGSGLRVGTLISAGDPADGPQKIRGGVPHGLHSPTVPPVKVTMARQASIPQMKPPRVDRPNNSKLAGQSYSQTLPQEGSTAINRTPRAANPGRSPGINSRFRTRT